MAAFGGLMATEEVLDYLHQFGARADEVLERVRADTIAHTPHPEMLITPDQGALIELLVRLTGARRALELGTYTGYSAICIARGLAPGGRLTCLELDADFATVAQRNLRSAHVADRVDITLGPANESLKAMPATEVFDFAFIDADKRRYPEYYELVLSRMRPGGLMLLDNTLYEGRVISPDRDTDNVQAIDRLNRHIHTDERVDMAMTVCADGLTLVRAR